MSAGTNTIKIGTTVNKFREWLSINYASIVDHHAYVMNRK